MELWRMGQTPGGETDVGRKLQMNVGGWEARTPAAEMTEMFRGSSMEAHYYHELPRSDVL